MNYSNKAPSSILSLIAVMAFAGQANAGEQAWSGIDAEVRSCVAKVSAEANYEDATRVRHAVVRVKARTVGYKLEIETALFNEQNEAPIREYATSCVVNGNNVPFQFSISETNNDA